MNDSQPALPELPNVVGMLEHCLRGTKLAEYLSLFENVIYSIFIIIFILVLTHFALKKKQLIPSGLQNIFEMFVEGFDNFICGILGQNGRKYTPFIGTLFIYILLMNIMGIIPFFKASTTSWSTTLALAICVFFYVQYSALKQLGFLGYMDHLSGNNRGFLAYTVVIPLLMFVLHVMTEFIKPFSLSLRLRSNMWGDDLLLAYLAGFGIKGLPLLIFNTFLAIIAIFVQTTVFCLLTTVYFALVMPEEEDLK